MEISPKMQSLQVSDWFIGYVMMMFQLHRLNSTE